ncbi:MULTISPECIES: hypothetical protein [unclassified Brevibacterium]|mgnify:CR=1 FL=1|jgi:hypothetical protein|uniref:hypothetical protein n=1 Tax=unclassified Brevibacterium TaxID=2614124 RepID=UPI003639A567
MVNRQLPRPNASSWTTAVIAAILGGIVGFLLFDPLFAVPFAVMGFLVGMGGAYSVQSAKKPNDRPDSPGD